MPSYVNHTTYAPSVGTTSHTINVPAGVANGDLMLVMFNLPVTTTFNALTGWTELWDATTTLSPDGFQVMVSWRVASSEPASYTWTSTGSGRPAAVLIAYRGCLPGGEINKSNKVDTGLTATHTSPSITPDYPGSLIVSLDNAYETAAGSAPSWTVDGNFTQRVVHENSNNHAGVLVADYAQPTAAAISCSNGLASTSQGIAGIVALAPSAKHPYVIGSLL